MSIKIKQKRCKGTGKCKGHGCGDSHYTHKYGLCLACFKNWVFNTDDGVKYLEKCQIQGTKKVEKHRRDETRKLKESIKKKSEFEKQLQTEVNIIVRLTDHSKGCISCNHGWKSKWTRKADAGHRKTVGAHPELRFNFFNIFKQCNQCNTWKSGNEREYDKGLRKHYGVDVLNRAKSLTLALKSLRLSKEDLKEKIIIARKIKKDILNGEDYTREELNNLLGIYINTLK